MSGRLLCRPSRSLQCKAKLENHCLKLMVCGKANRCGCNVSGVESSEWEEVVVVGGGGVQA